MTTATVETGLHAAPLEAGHAAPDPEPIRSTLPPRVYAATDGRKTVLSIVFLLFAPFLISFPIMFLKRTAYGAWTDAISTALIGTALLIWGWFLFREVMAAIRTKIIVGREKVRLRVPEFDGPNPSSKIRRLQVRYSSIEQVETRQEVFTTLKVPVLTRATSLVLKGGDRIVLGYQNEADDDPDIDFRAVATDIATRAGVPLADRGRVIRGSHLQRYRSKETPNWEREGSTLEEYEAYEKRGRMIFTGMTVALLGLVALGIFYDAYRTGFVQSLMAG